MFKYFRAVLGEWIEMTDPNSKKEDKFNIKKSLIDFPYSETPMSRDQFMEMDVEKCYEMCFPGINEGKETDDILQMPYKLQFKDVTGYWDECHYCGE